MLTSKDIKLLIESFKTRLEADADLARLEEKITTKDMFREVMTKIDAVFKELRDFRQEQNMDVQKHRDIDERLDKLESASPSL